MVTTTNLANDFVGLSTDTKPTDGVANGSTFVEMDTSTLYAFDEEGQAWLEISSSGGGGGGGGSDTSDLVGTGKVGYMTLKL